MAAICCAVIAGESAALTSPIPSSCQVIFKDIDVSAFCACFSPPKRLISPLYEEITLSLESEGITETDEKDLYEKGRVVSSTDS